MSLSSQRGVLLLNLGTPDAPTVPAVRRYLKQFLSDARVIDLPAALRWLLVNLVILPTRPRQSAKAYQKIWLATGQSPLLHYSEALAHRLKKQLGDNYCIVVGMRYANPSIASALAHLKHCQEIIILPLFPQYASASTGSAIAEVFAELNKQWNIPSVRVIHEFYQASGFINAYSQLITQTIANQSIDHIIFSYHGLPERHIHKSNCQAACDRTHPCPVMQAGNSFCYRAQCYTTSRLLADRLNLSCSKYTTAFQSRLGRTPWIKPYTDDLLDKLADQGYKRIAMVCPSFVADCLETLEEIGIRAREQWKQLGGTELILVPCLNDNPLWVDALVKLIQKQEWLGVES